MASLLCLILGLAALAAAPDPIAPPGVVIDHLPAASGRYVGSPSIAVLPDGAYVASHDEFGPQSGQDKAGVTRLFRSDDRGQTWRPLATVSPAFWSGLFVHRGQLYLLGTSKEYGDLLIRRSADGGLTWTTPTDATNGLLARGRWHTAPVPVVEHDGRVWRGVEDTAGGGGWGAMFRARVMSAPADADLLRADRWTFSEPVARNPAWLGGKFGGFLEGNAVVTPAGRVADVLRVAQPTRRDVAAVVPIGGDGKSAAFDPDDAHGNVLNHGGFFNLPGAGAKFTIRWDDKSRRYWSLVNFVPQRHRGPDLGGIRNTLALASSADLLNWRVDCVVLYHPDPARHGFQYADWQLDGEDLIAVVRTAFDDPGGGAHNYHDANFLTFHRIVGFRHKTMEDSVPMPQDAGTAGR